MKLNSLLNVQSIFNILHSRVAAMKYKTISLEGVMLISIRHQHICLNVSLQHERSSFQNAIDTISHDLDTMKKMTTELEDQVNVQHFWQGSNHW